MSVMIHFGLAPDQRPQAAVLYWQAFGAKLGRVMGPRARALEFIERVISEDHVLSALDGEGNLIGVIGYRTRSGSFVGGDKSDLRAVYGRFGALWRGLCLAILSRDEDARAMIVDGLAVTTKWRGAGIGAALVEALCDEAKRRGFREVRLDVVGENLRARALYERLGFKVATRRHSRLTALIFDFETSFVMVRKL
ncbi:GNAT family N-acetyltransferase [Sedimentimonas flavescens]|uniref:GNAT family N-acetyltransferase n=1 Tax=Sedimentimonas flavescens TaxID=2851012 RepID=UPI001C49DBE1|nr:GNAT family N-acetyltransferase [Sedimentimonas flavescens]MBW0157930.1 GNAT family N-acetyltransferase [Sedimentimonas flavescens]MCT2539944.1 GNAT family N-acetyltransferase [Sedimentimonas flavescens]WBL33431.1 GNAT family N-acetyltransferase [Sinirhodobacter sp. HNIBRBA609]